MLRCLKFDFVSYWLFKNNLHLDTTWKSPSVFIITEWQKRWIGSRPASLPFSSSTLETRKLKHFPRSPAASVGHASSQWDKGKHLWGGLPFPKKSPSLASPSCLDPGHDACRSRSHGIPWLMPQPEMQSRKMEGYWVMETPLDCPTIPTVFLGSSYNVNQIIFYLV